MQNLITYLVEDNPIVLSSLIEALHELTNLKIIAYSATQTEASQWLQTQNGNWHLAIVDLFLKEGIAENMQKSPGHSAFFGNPRGVVYRQ